MSGIWIVALGTLLVEISGHLRGDTNSPEGNQQTRSSSECLVVLPEYDAENDLIKITRLLSGTSCTVHIIAKGTRGCPENSTIRGTNGYVKYEGSCTPSPNVGCEFGSYADFIDKHYDSLPATLFFVPASKQNSRVRHLKPWEPEDFRQHFRLSQLLEP